MNLIESSKNEFLLEAPLEILHSQSIEWLEEIEFWKDESAFFCKLIAQRSKKATPLLNTKQAREVERDLIYICAEKLDDLLLEVRSHEKFLFRIMNEDRIDKQLYRSRHRTLAGKISDFEKEFRGMKKKIFQFVKIWKPVKVVRAS